MRHVELLETPLTPYAWLGHFESELAEKFGSGRFGAAAVFVGTMRDFNEGESVSRLFLEHYPGMTEKQLQQISEQISNDVLHTAIVHRVGHIEPGQAIVITAAWSAHRQAAFDACRQLIEALKHEAPFWKQEQRQTQGKKKAHWVQANTPLIQTDH